MILEQAKGPEGMTREQIESRIVVPRHSIFLQIFPLYVLPVIIIVAGYFFSHCSAFIITGWPEATVLPRGQYALKRPLCVHQMLTPNRIARFIRV